MWWGERNIQSQLYKKRRSFIPANPLLASGLETNSPWFTYNHKTSMSILKITETPSTLQDQQLLQVFTNLLQNQYSILHCRVVQLDHLSANLWLRVDVLLEARISAVWWLDLLHQPSSILYKEMSQGGWNCFTLNFFLIILFTGICLSQAKECLQ